MQTLSLECKRSVQRGEDGALVRGEWGQNVSGPRLLEWEEREGLGLTWEKATSASNGPSFLIFSATMLSA